MAVFKTKALLFNRLLSRYARAKVCGTARIWRPDEKPDEPTRVTSDDDDVDADGSSNSRSHDFRLAFAGAPCPIVPHLHKSLHHETLFYTLLDEM